MAVYHTAMPRVAPVVPAETDILCEKCGYTLNGLPDDGRCPECGEPIDASAAGDRRVPPAWERGELPLVRRFLPTTFSVLFRPKHFFRTLTTRGDLAPALNFARIHRAITAVLFGATGAIHTKWFWELNRANTVSAVQFALLAITLIVATFFAMTGVTTLAAKLTNWEATYRGLRMPIAPVLRGMYYHTAHYVPVALIAFITVEGYMILLEYRVLSATSASQYLYTLCAEVVVGALYLFQTYWIAMRNMMYANR